MPGNFAAGGTVHHVEIVGAAGKVFKVTLASEKTNRKTRQVEPTFVTVTMFSAHGERAQKGAYLMVFGTVEGREHAGRFYTELVAESVDVVGAPPRQSAPPRSAPPAQAPANDGWDAPF